MNLYWHALHEQTSRVYPREHITRGVTFINVTSCVDSSRSGNPCRLSPSSGCSANAICKLSRFGSSVKAVGLSAWKQHSRPVHIVIVTTCTVMDQSSVIAVVISLAYLPISFAYHLRSIGMTGLSGCADRSREIKKYNNTDSLRSRVTKQTKRTQARALDRATSAEKTRTKRQKLEGPWGSRVQRYIEIGLRKLC